MLRYRFKIDAKGGPFISSSHFLGSRGCPQMAKYVCILYNLFCTSKKKRKEQKKWGKKCSIVNCCVLLWNSLVDQILGVMLLVVSLAILTK